MKKILIIIPALLLTVSCTTTSKQEKLQTVEVSYLDLSQKQQKDLAEQYWLTKKAPNPHYPIQAAKENLSGCVELIVGINEQGELQGYKVRSSYPKGVFENSAIAALRQW
ncbi:energy transducer TonB [Pseudoalteromonas fenneropenaei]|uniref:Energy transducer TonB n=1 Tax=Pseudoalteromonas fenneropenaei TaxID=1737459 RepID=A0ABV7CHQ8_9GAMM